MEPVAPCKDCPERKPGCHDKCERYQEFRKVRQEFNIKMAELRNHNGYLGERRAKNYAKQINRRTGGRK